MDLIVNNFTVPDEFSIHKPKFIMKNTEKAKQGKRTAVRNEFFNQFVPYVYDRNTWNIL